ncbi:MAG: phosphate uptake regulator PhoU [Candidatus Thorarchaeota archaeon]|nr:MAG: phosphate uptake regulator PhoU [Candidatus Thorarchaeota archaeon]
MSMVHRMKRYILLVLNVCHLAPLEKSARGKCNKHPPKLNGRLPIQGEEIMVITRTLQQTGGKTGSSFLIILPKDWVIKQKLSKGDPVFIAEREDGCLIIDPRFAKTGEPRTTIAKIEQNLRWEITSRYLLGFDEIRIVSKESITNSQRNELERMIKRFVALEITEEDDHQIVLRCLVDPSTLPVNTALRRMHQITSRMIDDSLNAYFIGDSEAAEEVVQRDEEVDRLFFLIVRELRSAIQYPRMSEAMKLTPVKALDFRLAVQYLERIADLAVDIAQRVEEPIDISLIKKIEPIAKEVQDMFSDAVKNLFKFDPKKVTFVINAEKRLISKTAKLRQYIVASPNGQPHTQVLVVDSLLRMGETAKDIVDLALPQHD